MSPQDKCVLSFYREMEPIGDAGKVFLVRHIETGQVCVRKRLSAYSRELYLYLKTKRLSGIPTVYECLDDDEFIVVIEEYIGGKTLRQVMTEEGPFSNERAVKIILRLCDTLIGLHESSKPVVCRDLKPENIILTGEDNPYIIDFDSAKFVRPGLNDTLLLGTPGYAAPEQFGFAVSDERTDIFALGVIFNEMLTGALPQVKAAKGRYGDIIARCTSLDPNDRPEKVRLLRQKLGGGKVKSKWTLPGFRRGNFFFIMIAVCGYIAALAMALYYMSGDVDPERDFYDNLLLAFFWLELFCWTVAYLFNYVGIRDNIGERVRIHKRRFKIFWHAFIWFLGMLIALALAIVLGMLGEVVGSFFGR